MLKPFSKLGVVLRKGQRTETAIAALREELKGSIVRWLCRIDGTEPTDEEVAKHFEWASNEDEDLAAFTLGMGAADAEVAMRDLLYGGLVLGEHLVATSADKVVGELPPWLRWEFASTGNPPELEAKMEPEVRAMWRRSRYRLYGLSTDEMRAQGVRQMPVIPPSEDFEFIDAVRDAKQVLALGERSPNLFMVDGMAASLAPMLRAAGVAGPTTEWLQGYLFSYERSTVDVPRLQQLQEWCRQFLAAVEAGWLPDRG